MTVLELGYIPIEEIEWGPKTFVQDAVLCVHREELIEKARGDDPRIASATAHIAKPGESVRIVPVKDVIEPRVKVEGKGGIFPGLISGVESVGSGRTHVLRGCAVVTAGQVVGVQEGLIDMSGPGARYSPFSKTLNVVLAIDVKHGISQHEHEEALRLAGLRAATYLGEAGRRVEPVAMDRFEVRPPFRRKGENNDLPGLVYVYMLLSQGLLHDTYLYGQNVASLLPTIMMGTEVMDGAIVSGNCVSACDKNTTYHHQNNPVIQELFRRDGVDLRFLGTVVGNCNVTLRDKMRSAQYGVKVVESLGADGAIITKEGFGNPDADAMMYCTGLEEKGIRTVMIADEFAGVDGASQSLADTSPRADAVVSAGNANERISLPPMDKVIGDVRVIEKMAGIPCGSVAKQDVAVELQAILGATNELGFGLLSAREE